MNINHDMLGHEMRRTKDQCSESVVSGQIKQLTEAVMALQKLINFFVARLPQDSDARVDVT